MLPVGLSDPNQIRRQSRIESVVRCSGPPRCSDHCGGLRCMEV